MAWYYEKIEENDDTVVYAYGTGTKTATGQLRYKKNTGEYSIIKMAENDTAFMAEWALTHLCDVVKAGFPDRKIVMIG